MIMGRIQQRSYKMSSSEQEREGRREERGGWRTHWVFRRQGRGGTSTGNCLKPEPEHQRRSTYRGNHQPASDLSSVTTVVCRWRDPMHTERRTPGCRLYI